MRGCKVASPPAALRRELASSWCVVSTPSIPGISRSISTTSGAYSLASCTASCAVPASATTTISGWVSRKPRTPLRTSAWSSTNRTVIGSAIVFPSSRWLQRAGTGNACPTPRRAFDGECATHYQALLRSRSGTEFMDECIQVGVHLVDRRFGIAKVRLCTLAIALKQDAGRADLHGSDEDLLFHRVMEFSRQPQALLTCRHGGDLRARHAVPG